jgi:hypothetical protein
VYVCVCVCVFVCVYMCVCVSVCLCVSHMIITRKHVAGVAFANAGGDGVALEPHPCSCDSCAMTIAFYWCEFIV